MHFLLALLLAAATTAAPNPERWAGSPAGADRLESRSYVNEDAVVRVSVEETRAALARNDAVIVDVRGDVPFQLERIAGSVSIPLGLIATRASELPHDKLIVTYCSCKKDDLSVAAVLALQKAGVERAAALHGGLPAWVAAGLPTESDNHEPPIVNEDPEPATAARGGRIGPPPGVTCDRSHLTVYSGRVTAFTKTKAKTTITIATDWDTTETNVSAAPRFLLNGAPMHASDWKRVGKGKRANVWVCREKGKATVIDWRPDEENGS